MRLCSSKEKKTFQDPYPIYRFTYTAIACLVAAVGVVQNVALMWLFITVAKVDLFTVL